MHVNHRYTTDASERVIKLSKISSSLTNHSCFSRIGVRSLGWIKMHLSIQSWQYSSSISSSTSIRPVSPRQIVENIFISAKLFVSVQSKNAVMSRSQMVPVQTFSGISRSKQLPTHLFHCLQESKVQQNSQGVKDRGKKIDRVLRDYSLWYQSIHEEFSR